MRLKVIRTRLFYRILHQNMRTQPISAHCLPSPISTRPILFALLQLLKAKHKGAQIIESSGSDMGWILSVMSKDFTLLCPSRKLYASIFHPWHMYMSHHSVVLWTYDIGVVNELSPWAAALLLLCECLANEGERRGGRCFLVVNEHAELTERRLK